MTPSERSKAWARFLVVLIGSVIWWILTVNMLAWVASFTVFFIALAAGFESSHSLLLSIVATAIGLAVLLTPTFLAVRWIYNAWRGLI
jgi:hypothetical protein